jgi:polygalacturonase
MSLTKATYSMIEGAPLNVLDFGAIQNNSTDNTAAVQAAINSLGPYGGLVVIPYGCKF